MGHVKVPLFGLLTVLGLVGLDWEEELDDDEFFEGSSEEVDRKCNCEGVRGLCDRVASRGSRHIDSGYSFLGSVLYGNRRDKMVLRMRRSGGGDDRVLGGRRIHRGDGR